MTQPEAWEAVAAFRAPAENLMVLCDSCHNRHHANQRWARLRAEEANTTLAAVRAGQMALFGGGE